MPATRPATSPESTRRSMSLAGDGGRRGGRLCGRADDRDGLHRTVVEVLVLLLVDHHGRAGLSDQAQAGGAGLLRGHLVLVHALGARRERVIAGLVAVGL